MHGQAIALYHLGYIYAKCAEDLVIRFDDDKENHDVLCDSQKACKQKAIDYYEQAFEKFEIVNHLLAMYICKKNILMYTTNNSNRNELQRETVKLHMKYEDFYLMNSKTEDKCSYIARKQGEDFSILT